MQVSTATTNTARRHGAHGRRRAGAGTAGKFDRGAPVGPFASEGESLLQLHHEFAFCAQLTFKVRNAPNTTTPARDEHEAGGRRQRPGGVHRKVGHWLPKLRDISPAKLSWWFNTSMLQFGLLKEAGIKVPALRPGVVQPRGQPCPSR